MGPTQDGLITPLFEERLLQLGEWLEINGEAIYGSSPWIYQTDEINNNTYYTCIKDHYDPYKTAAPPVKATDVSIVYTIFFKWPLNSIIKVRNIMAFMKETPCLVMLLGENMYLTVSFYIILVRVFLYSRHPVTIILCFLNIFAFLLTYFFVSTSQSEFYFP